MKAGEIIKTTVLAFDLSSVCIGVIAAQINNTTKSVEKIMSCPIIPPKFEPTSLGYLKSKKKITTSAGKTFSSYMIPGEKTVSEKEKKRRDSEVRHSKNNFVMEYIASNISTLMNKILPDIVIAERNEIFNGILTSTLLSEIMGSLEGVTYSKNIPLLKIPVKDARGILNLSQITKDFVSSVSEEYLKSVPDITKRSLRMYMEQIYGELGLKCNTDDESDACVVFHYWYIKKYLRGDESV